VNVTEVQGMEGSIITLQDIFAFNQESYEDGKVVGQLRPTGIRPAFMTKLEDAGHRLPPSVFGIRDQLF
jgi:pilus assembly protein CpaF